MPLAWTCRAEPDRHGSFLQTGLQELSARYGAAQPINRFACPICIANGEPGWVEAASATAAARIAAHQNGV